MSFLAWLNPGRWLLMLAAFGVATAGYYAWSDRIGDAREAQVRASYEKALLALKVDAAKKLEEATFASGKLTEELAKFKVTQDKGDVKNTTTIQSLRTQLGAVRLRDPGTALCGCCGSGTTSEAGSGAGIGSVNSSASAGILSDAASEFLRAKASEADTINLAYMSCRAVLINDRAVLQP